MDKDTVIELALPIVMVLVVLVISGSGWYIKSHFEAKTYNKLTGNSVSTWDALWVQLRVQDAPNNNGTGK